MDTLTVETAHLSTLRAGDQLRPIGRESWATVTHQTRTSLSGTGPSGEWLVYLDEVADELVEVLRGDQAPPEDGAVVITLRTWENASWLWHSTYHLAPAASTAQMLEAGVPYPFLDDMRALLDRPDGTMLNNGFRLLIRGE